MNDDTVDFRQLEKEFAAAVAADEKYQRENDAKFRAIHQKVGTYEEFRDIVRASHLKPLDRKDILSTERKQPWNCVAVSGGSGAIASGSLEGPADTIVTTRTGQLPQTSSEFNRQWRQCKTERDKSSFLLYIGGQQLLKIFRTEISFGLLGDMMTAMNKSFESDNAKTVVDILECLSQTGRFSLTCQFLSSNEKFEISRLFEKLETTSEAELSRLRETYLGN
ncbi:coiled-coil domain-containing protein 103-like [Corticium candelabrum]|uniref:coiled-coil domain-containing protein 103-like n=1 Tax=Corticium candelabrum TaxID=121492 RepID=UPI002E266551|nr:coiled-coil domain-containing protein 103-like [Corticium candelabrum]